MLCETSVAEIRFENLDRTPNRPNRTLGSVPFEFSSGLGQLGSGSGSSYDLHVLNRVRTGSNLNLQPAQVTSAAWRASAFNILLVQTPSSPLPSIVGHLVLLPDGRRCFLFINFSF